MGGITDSLDTSLGRLWDIVKNRKAWHVAVHGGRKELDTTEQLNNGIVALNNINSFS